MAATEYGTPSAPTAPPAAATRRPVAPVEFSRPAPVKVWATIGVAFLALEAYVLISWFASGDLKPVPSGPTPIPESDKVLAIVIQSLGVVLATGVLYWVLIRPWRRDRRLTADGLLLLAVALVYWQDPFLNYTQNWATINTAFLNVGSWTAQLPGWLSPHRFAEAPLWAGVAYIWAVFGAMVIANKVMDKARARWPRIGVVGLIGVCFAFIAVFDFVFEVGFMRLGMFAYGGAIKGLTIFYGHYYQFPIYETIFFGGLWTAFACLRYFKDDRGLTVVERGLDRVRTTPRRRTVLRFLALCGAVNVLYIVCFNGPIQLFALHAGAWPKDIVSRSYLTDDFCGPGTSYACSSPSVPIPRSNSAHVGPDGRLVGAP